MQWMSPDGCRRKGGAMADQRTTEVPTTSSAQAADSGAPVDAATGAGPDPVPSSGAGAAGRAGGRLSALPAALTGLGIGLLVCVLNILVLFRTGAGFGGSALVVLLGVAALRVIRRLRFSELFVVFSVASSGYFATAALDTGVAAAWLGNGRVPAWPVLVALAVGANLLGAGIGALVARSYVDRAGLPYPTLQPAISLITLTTGQTGRRTTRTLTVAAVVSALVTLAAVGLGADQGLAVPGLPTFLALVVSPLLLGVGMLIGGRACLWLAVGGAYSALVWWQQERGSGGPVSYPVHLAYPWILACGVGVAVGHALGTLGRSRAVLRRAVWAPWIRQPVALGAVLVALAAVAVLVLVRPRAGWVVAVLVVVPVLLGLWVVFFNRAGGEVGIVPLAPALYLSVAVLAALRVPTSVALLGAATLCCAAVASVYYTYAAKVATTAPADQQVPLRRVWWTQALGGAVGAAVGIVVVLLVSAAGAGGAGMGGRGFPVPVAHALGFVASAAAGSAGYGGLVGLGFAGGAVAGALATFTPVLPTMLGLGVLLPPAFTLTVAAGGAIRWAVLRRRPDAGTTVEQWASGLVIGEGLMMVIVLARRALLA
jgi:hypothetical protein